MAAHSTIALGKGTLEDILNGPDEFGLLNVSLGSSVPAGSDILATRFYELNQWVDAHDRAPTEFSEDLSERQMAQRMATFQQGPRSESLVAIDRHGLLDAPLQPAGISKLEPVLPPVVLTNGIAPEDVMSIDDILGGEDFGLLDLGDTSILTMKNIPNAKEPTDEVAQRRPCVDFWRFESIFRNLHSGMKSGNIEAVPFAKNWQIDVGESFILYGLLCFVDSVGEEHDRSARVDARLRLIFENGTESNMLRSSLGKELYADEHGRRILRERSEVLAEAFQDIRLTHRDRRTGLIYIVRTASDNPVLTQYPSLFKIGYTELTLDERISNAEHDTAFLENTVHKAAEFECFNMNPQRFESLIHGFFAVQRLNIELTGKDGKVYRPREWFAVTLDVAREAISKIIDGTIVQFRMDNTTGRIIRKGSTIN